jgi:hypothetical protein
VSERGGGAVSGFQRLITQSLAARFLTIAIVSIFGLILAGAVAQAAFNRQMLRLLIDPELTTVADNLIGNAGPGLSGEIVLRDLPYDPRYLQAVSGRYFQIARIQDDGFLDVQVISPSLYDVTINLLPEQQAIFTGASPPLQAVFLDVPGPDQEPLRVVARVAEIPDLEGRYLFLVGIASQDVLKPAANIVGVAFAVFVAFCALMVTIATVLQVRIGLAPLHRLTKDIAAVRRGQSERLDREYPAELHPVTQELNALVDHNREVVERARRHVGNLAHALKTPIAVLKNAAGEGGADDAVMKQSIEEMEGFVERQLRRARVAARADHRLPHARAAKPPRFGFYDGAEIRSPEGHRYLGRGRRRRNVPR